MHLTEFLDFEAIKPALPAGNKRSLFQQRAALAGGRLGIAPAAILETINEREQLGSTGFGQGVEWCVVGLDRNWAFNPACKAAKP